MSVYPPADTLAIKAGNVDMTGNATVSSNLTVSGTISGSGAGLTSIPSSAISGTLSQWTTNGTTINYMDGNVGIGVASPGAELHVAGDGAIIVPSGTEAQRPTPYVAGMVRYNTEDTKLEIYNGTVWESVTSGTPPLYSFTSPFTFTNAGIVGRNGPTITQVRDQYSTSGTTAWVHDAQNYLSMSNARQGIQEWTVPNNGTYQIKAYGAAGGSKSNYSAEPGKGASMQGDFTLSRGEIIRILVGQRGEVAGPGTCDAAPGGGGTFVVRTPYNTNASILVIAGGGGGVGTVNSGHAGQNATAQTDGTGGTGGWTTNVNGGGTNGAGGAQPPNTPCAINYVSGSGGGFLTNGGGATGGPGSASTGGGISFVNGGLGGDKSEGSNGSDYKDGGFGGGGMGNYGAGAGGGYSGGAGGQGTSCSCNAWRGGGGGGSYNSGTNQQNTSVSGSGWPIEGSVIITQLS